MRRHIKNMFHKDYPHKLLPTIKFALGSYQQYHQKHQELSSEDGVISPYIIEKTLQLHQHKLIEIKNKKDLEDYLKKL